MKNSLLIIFVFGLLLQQTSQVVALDPEDDVDQKLLISTTWKSWAADKKISKSYRRNTASRIYKSRDSNEASIKLAKAMTNTGASYFDIVTCFEGNGINIRVDDFLKIRWESHALHNKLPLVYIKEISKQISSGEDFEKTKTIIEIELARALWERSAIASNRSPTNIWNISRQIRLSKTSEEALRILTNTMVCCGGSPNEIQEILEKNGFKIPDSAKLDWGLHEKFLSRSSFLGSVSANATAIWNDPIRWLVNNFSTSLGYAGTLHMMMGLIPGAATEATPDVCIGGHTQCLTPSAAAQEVYNKVTTSGTWNATCPFKKVEDYVSPDPQLSNVKLYRLTAHCNTSNPSEPLRINQKVIAGKNPPIFSNRDGELAIETSSGIRSLEEIRNLTCADYPGSYNETCTVKTTHLNSSDPEIDQEFCKTITQCPDMENRIVTTNTIFFKYMRETAELLNKLAENCNGIIVLNSDDRRCYNKAASEIRVIANSSNTVHLLGD